jgi:hypothetical protein
VSLHQELKSMAGIIRSVAERADFGFTAGASSAGIMAIMDTNDLISEMLQRREASNHSERIQQITRNLGSMELERRASSPAGNRTASVSRLHLKVFHLGVLTYLHRSITNCSPRDLSQLVQSTFNAITEFEMQGGRNLGLWPLFMVAVEVYNAELMTTVRNWLQRTAMLGIGNRVSVQQLLEEVWRRREQAAVEIGVDTGEITIDWREVMSELGLEILLI